MHKPQKTHSPQASPRLCSTNVADKYIGIPFVEHGRDETGVDCWGLVVLFYIREFGIELPDYHEAYGSINEHLPICTTIRKHLPEWQHVDTPVTGDCVLLRLVGVERHIGIFIQPNKMLHASAPVGSVVLESLDTPKWRNRIEGFYRYA